LSGVQSIRLDQGALQLKGAEQDLEGGSLAGFVGVVGLLGKGNTKRAGMHRDLDDKEVTPSSVCTADPLSVFPSQKSCSKPSDPPGIWLIIQA